MKHFNPLLSKAQKFCVLFVLAASLSAAFTSCSTNNDDDDDASINGSWVSTFYEKYEVTNQRYDNFYSTDNGATFTISYSTDSVQIVPTDETSGYVFGKFYDATKLGYGAEVGEWYAIHYKNLKKNSVSISQAYKAGGKASCGTLEEAKSEYSVENGYFTGYSECVRQ